MFKTTTQDNNNNTADPWGSATTGAGFLGSFMRAPSSMHGETKAFPQQTKHVTFEDHDNGECVPMDISGE